MFPKTRVTFVLSAGFLKIARTSWYILVGGENVRFGIVGWGCYVTLTVLSLFHLRSGRYDRACWLPTGIWVVGP